MKTINFIWNHYEKDCLTFKSYKNLWVNNLGKSNPDIEIYIDNFSATKNSIVFLVEPKSIFPSFYEHVKNNYNNFSYIISYDNDYFKNFPNFVSVSPPFGSWINGIERQIFSKNKNISFVASTKEYCQEHKFRQDMVRMFSNSVDIFGRGRTSEIQKKVDALSNYRFSIAMENHITDLYYTEKVLDCFLTGAIPIYWGSKKIENIFNGKGIVYLEDLLNNKISLEDLNQNFYNSKISYVIENFYIANKMHNSVGNSIDNFIEKIGINNL